RRDNASGGPRSGRIPLASCAVVFAQEHLSRRIGEPEAVTRETKTLCIPKSPTARDEIRHLDPPLQPEVEAGPFPERLERPSGVHPQPERGRFTGAAQG